MASVERVESSSNESQFRVFEAIFRRIFDEETKWLVPCGGCKQFKNAAVYIRWYSTSKSLIIKGPECDDLKTRLRILASETNEEQSGEDDANLNKSVNINNTDSTMQSNVLCDNCSDLAKRIDLLEERMNENLSGISKTLNGSKRRPKNGIFTRIY